MAGAAVGALATSFCNPAAEELGKCFVEIIKRPFSYLFCFNSNIQSLRDEAQKLKDKRDGLRGQVDNEENNARVIVPEVETWLSDTNQILVAAEQVENDVQNAQNGSWTIRSRYSLSKKAKETAERMKELRNDSKFDLISLPAPPPAQASVPVGETREFQSRKQIEEDVLKALQDKKVTKIGICGMGGVGKTTMAKKVMKRVRELNLFDETLLVAVSQRVDMFKIQLEIAECLRLKFEVETLQARAHQLSARLTGTKKVLVVLDDIWGKLKLEELGIPCEGGHRGCTTLLTSRDREVLNQMDVEVFAMHILQEGEAWSLFREKAGICVHDSNLVSVAEEVAKECKGLPVAIVTVGCALKDKRQPIWKNALQQLQTANPRNIPDVLEDVYNPLLLSYKFLKDRQAESLFLFCCLFPEDFDISLEDLTMYGMGLGLFERVDTLEQARYTLFTIVDFLKSRSLLQDGEYRHRVKMHDVIRDVAIFIALEERLADVHHRSRDVDWKWISVFSKTNDEFPDYLTGGSNFSNLCFLAIRGPMEIKDFSFLEGMKQLSVLSLYRISFESLPETIQLLKNLRTLRFERCEMESISTVGELLNLEILGCYSCDKIKELPVEIAKLKRLRLLDISDCRRLSRIAPGIISKLVKLEELKMRRSFKGWESANVKQEERRNASLKELESLSKLRHLEIEIADVNLVAEELRLSSYIVKYFIDVGDSRWRFGLQSDKCIGLKLPRERINLGGWIYEFIRSTEGLRLEGDGSKVLDLSQVQNTVTTLEIKQCRAAKKLVDTRAISTNRREYFAFPLLEYLYLNDLPSLEEICEGPILYGSNSFNKLKELQLDGLPALKHLWKSPNQRVSLCNLRRIQIWSCGSLRNLFLLGTAEGGLPQLESLEIEKCDVMEEVFPNEENEEDRKKGHVTFPKLRELKLRNLPSLQTFCRGEIESIEFPVLEALNISNCPKLRSMVSPVESNQNWPNHNDDDQSLHLFCNEKIKFDGLTHLMVEGCDDFSNIWCQQIPPYFFEKLEALTIFECSNIRSLFSSSIVRNLFNLKELEIEYCNNIEKVIANEVSCDIFPALEYLEMCELPNLKAICDDLVSKGSDSFRSLNTLDLSNLPALEHLWKNANQNISLSNLRRANINGCNKMRSLFSFTASKDDLLQLESLNIQKCEMMEVVFSNEKHGKTEKRSHMEFPKLKKLVLDGMPSLTTFSNGIESTDFPVLNTMRIRNCSKLVSIVSPVNRSQNLADDHSIESLHLFCSPKVSCDIFPALEYLEMCKLPNLKAICDDLVSKGSDSFKSLNTLDLSNLPSLEHLWKNANQNVSLGNLHRIQINACGRMRNLFSLTALKDDLLQLESLDIQECGMMEEVFSNEKNGKTEKRSHMEFPKLEELELDGLPNLTTFSNGIESMDFPVLNTMRIRNCSKLVSIVSPVNRSQNLVDDHSIESLHLFCSPKVKIGGLTHLVLQGYDDISNIWCQKVSLRFFERLERLEICECNNIWKLFSYSIAENFVNLVALSINNCNKMKKVITHKDDHLQLKSPYMQRCEMMEEVSLNEKNEMNENCSHLTFPKLKKLELRGMPSLTTFSNGIESMDFPVLNSMIIQNCPKLVSIVSPVDWNQNLADDHDIESLHLFCSPKVNFDKLSDLRIIGSVSHLWCPQIPPSFFQKLESLSIGDHGKIKSLFFSPTAESLVNLERLEIFDCNQMEKVTAEEMGQVMAGEKRVGEGSVLFPRLNWLRLQRLPLLGSFCERRRALELPLLRDVYIFECPRMESWTPGSLSTPNLGLVWTDRQVLGC